MLLYVKKCLLYLVIHAGKKEKKQKQKSIDIPISHKNQHIAKNRVINSKLFFFLNEHNRTRNILLPVLTSENKRSTTDTKGSRRRDPNKNCEKVKTDLPVLTQNEKDI